MKHKILYLFTIFLLISGLQFSAEAQTMDALKKERKEIQERINETNKLLKQTQKNEKESEKKLNVLKKNLNDRRTLINNYTAEINALDHKINKLTNERIELEKQLEKHKGDYADLVRKTQTNMHSHTKLMFLLSAKDFDQTLRRVRYLREFTDYKKEQVKRIESVKNRIALKTDSLDQNKSAKVVAVKAKQLEAERLKKDENDEKALLAVLQQEEKRLSEAYRAHQRKKDQIDNKIQQVIEEEIRKAEARRKAEEARRRAEAEARRKIEEQKLAQARAAEQKRQAEARAAEQRRQEAELLAKKSGETTPRKKRKTAPPKPVVEIAKVEETPKVETAKPTETQSKPSETGSYMTKEDQLLSGGFANNRGRLPWPVDRGYIRGHFGFQPHPELKHVNINNKGVYFRSPAETNARAVYEGFVARVFALPGTGYAVLIQHGDYRSLYANLSEVYVRAGERVRAKQPLGKIFTDDETGQAELQFNMYSGSTLINPENWLTR